MEENSSIACIEGPLYFLHEVWLGLFIFPWIFFDFKLIFSIFHVHMKHAIFNLNLMVNEELN